MIDLYMSFVNAEGRTNLGTWLQRQEAKNLAPRLANARKTLRDCRVPQPELRSQWAAQKAAQSSVRARKPNFLCITTFIASPFARRCPCSPQTRIG
jgi:hypothetical protein